MHSGISVSCEHFLVSKPVILILDPDAFLAGIYARRFEAGGWKVRVAETEVEARKILVRLSPDAILVDVQTVPRGAGFLRELRSHPKARRSCLVVLTAMGDRSSIDEAMRSGADAYLLKGHFVPSEVRTKVERLVAAKKRE